MMHNTVSRCPSHYLLHFLLPLISLDFNAKNKITKTPTLLNRKFSYFSSVISLLLEVGWIILLFIRKKLFCCDFVAINMTNDRQTFALILGSFVVKRAYLYILWQKPWCVYHITMYTAAKLTIVAQWGLNWWHQLCIRCHWIIWK